MAQAAQRLPVVSGAREAILEKLARGRSAPSPIPAYTLPAWSVDPGSHFIAKAKTTVAQISEIASPLDAPAAVAAIMEAAGLEPRLHIPAASPLNNLPWQRASGLALSGAPPSGEDCAMSVADYAIAETGTLVFLSSAHSPSSWHFRPGREFVLLTRGLIMPRLEDVIAVLAAQGMPATLNLVTGPSRTADIEQTIELGAHGPREVHILLSP
jgi:L-lactate dehydrogenase complex protein LldG